MCARETLLLLALSRSELEETLVLLRLLIKDGWLPRRLIMMMPIEVANESVASGHMKRIVSLFTLRSLARPYEAHGRLGSSPGSLALMCLQPAWLRMVFLQTKQAATTSPLAPS